MNDMDDLVKQARMLCQELRQILERMELPPSHPDAYNDAWRDRIEHIFNRALRRYERRMRLWLMD